MLCQNTSICVFKITFHNIFIYIMVVSFLKGGTGEIGRFSTCHWKFLSHNVIACPWLATGRWFSPDTPVSPTNKTDHHDIAEILLKVALNTINQPTYHIMLYGVQIASGWRWTRRQIVAVTSFPYGQYNTIIIRSRPRLVEFKRRIFFS